MCYSISVIIPTMNRPKSLRQTIGHIAESTNIPTEIIVVDQSTDLHLKNETYNVIQSFRNRLNICYDYQNIPSLTKARNRGLQLAGEEIIVFMDDDVDVRSTTFEHVNSLMRDAKISLVGGYNEGELDIKNSGLGYLFGKSSYKKRNYGHVSSGLYGRFPLSKDLNIETEWAMGFFFAIRKSLVDKWKCKFDEKLKYYAYAEDLDFTYGYYLNAQKEGYKCILSRHLIVRHNVSTEYRLTSYKVTMMEMVHREYIAHKYRFSSLSLLWCNIGTFMYRLLKRNRPMDVISAIIFIQNNRQLIFKGNLLYKEYMH